MLQTHFFVNSEVGRLLYGQSDIKLGIAVKKCITPFVNVCIGRQVHSKYKRTGGAEDESADASAADEAAADEAADASAADSASGSDQSDEDEQPAHKAAPSAASDLLPANYRRRVPAGASKTLLSKVALLQLLPRASARSWQLRSSASGSGKELILNAFVAV